MSTVTAKPPLPPFTKETAIRKIRMAEDAWNSQDPDRVKMAYTPDSVWRNRDTFLQGRDEIRQFLNGKWDREQDYRLIKELWAYSENRIAVRFCYEYHNADGQWFRAHGKSKILNHTNLGPLLIQHLGVARLTTILYSQAMRIGNLTRMV